MKDNFSEEADKYARYRPSYPDEFFEFLRTLVPHPENTWDCGTGNGQVAEKLAEIATHVYATDISQTQLEQAVAKSTIIYSRQPAEKTNFENDFFDLIVVAQAVHWFDFEAFYSEVKRTAKNNALLVVMGYGKLSITPELDLVLDKLYYTVLGEYWDRERKYIDENYQTIPFPFEELPAPDFQNTYTWSFKHLIGYLETWSAVKHYRRQHAKNPIDLVYQELEVAWGKAMHHEINFPLLLRIGKIEKPN